MLVTVNISYFEKGNINQNSNIQQNLIPGEFLLKYDDVRANASPDDAVLDFLQSTYEAGANLAKWDRKLLERDPASDPTLQKPKPR